MKSVHGQFRQNLFYAHPSVSLLLFSTECFQSPIIHTSPIPFHRSSGASVSIRVQVLNQRNTKDAREKLCHSKDNILAGDEAPLVTLELRRWKQSQQETQLNPLCSGRMEEGRDARMQKSRELFFESSRCGTKEGRASKLADTVRGLAWGNAVVPTLHKIISVDTSYL